MQTQKNRPFNIVQQAAIQKPGFLTQLATLFNFITIINAINFFSLSH